MQQVTLNFEAGPVDAYATCREYIAALVHQQGRPQKSIAADMDCSPSDLSRKLAQHPDDTRRFGIDDLERFVTVTGDTRPILYLVAKYLTDHDRIAELEAEIARLKGGKVRVAA